MNNPVLVCTKFCITRALHVASLLCATHTHTHTHARARARLRQLSARHGCGLKECHNITVEKRVFLTCVVATITQLLLSNSRNEVLTYV